MRVLKETWPDMTVGVRDVVTQTRQMLRIHILGQLNQHSVGKRDLEKVAHSSAEVFVSPNP